MAARAPKNFRLVESLGEQHIGLEARAQVDDHLDTKIWLRLLACSTQIETEIRRRLRAQFGTTLPRFDYLAQLHRHPEGMRMNELSRHLMVTGGSITGLTDQLEKEGFVQRENAPEDWQGGVSAALEFAVTADNLTDKVRLWTDTGYRFLKRQSSTDSGRWVTIENGTSDVLVGALQ